MVKKKANPAFPRRDRDICWICEERPANSQEHAFKSSRIKKIWKAGGEQPLGTIGSDGRIYKMSGPNHGIFMFGKTICSYCNNQFSQPFDKAYDHFMDFILDDLEYYRNRRDFHWDEVFAGTPYDQGDLARYYVKHFGCKMYDAGYEVPEDLRLYLHDPEMVHTFSLLLYKDYEHVQGLDPSRPEEWFTPFSNYGELVDDNDKRTGFVGCLQDGFIGVIFRWEDEHIRIPEQWCFGFQPVTYMRDVHELPYQNLWDGLPRNNEISEVSKEMERVAEEIYRFNDDFQRFIADQESGAFTEEELFWKGLAISVRQKTLETDLERVKKRQKKLMDQLGFDPVANAEPKRRQSKSKDGTP